MIKMSVYYHEVEEYDMSLLSIINYARERYLFVWKIQSENDAQYIETSKPTQHAIHAWLVTDTELGHFLHEEDLSKDDIPF
jgi:hypothetical protein